MGATHTIRNGEGGGAAALVTGWLALAATPTFAALALLNGAQPSPLCVGAPDGWPVGDMTLMYLLMSVFHAAPWIKLIRGSG